MAGPKCASQRQKVAKRLRQGSQGKKFKETNSEAMARYKEKLTKRANRKLKKKSRRK